MNECNTDADTCCLGVNFVVLEATRQEADVYGYDKTIAPKRVPIVSGATAYEHVQTDMVYILIFHELLYYGMSLNHLLINPNQLRSYGVLVWDNPFDKERSFGIDVNNELFIPFTTMGTKVYFKSRTPTMEEIRDCLRIEVTCRDTWDPENVVMDVNKVRVISRTEVENIELSTKIRMTKDGLKYYERGYAYDNPDSDEAMLHEIDPSLVHFKMNVNKVDPIYNPDLDNLRRPRSFVSTEQHSNMTVEKVSKLFNISLDQARATLRGKRQKGTRSAILPLSRRYEADR